MLTDLAKAADSPENYPPALKNRPPKPPPWQRTYMDAFNTLNSSRNYTSASAAAIPYPYMLAWLDEHRIFDLSEREVFIDILQAIDSTYLNIVNKSIKQAGENNG